MPFSPTVAALLAQVLTLHAQPPAEKPPAAEPAEPSNVAVPKPHPMITEVLYAVPTGDGGDASGDGKRSATGDEFIELVNPHDKPINLKGYTLTDKSLGKAGSLKFVFPDCTLQPGQVAVVFNGFECTWTGPVGDAASAPKEGHKSFGGAFVFSMKVDSTRNALSNSGDAVCLMAPDGAAIHVVKWGKGNEKLPAAKRTEEAPSATRGSVQRTGTGPDAKFAPHESVPAAGGGSAEPVRFSPGKFGTGGASSPSEPKKDAAPDEPGKPDKKKKGGG